MGPYIFLFCLTLFFMVLNYKFVGVWGSSARFHYHPMSFYLFFILVFVLFLFTSFRSDVGWDYHSYYDAIAYNVDNNVISRGELFTVSLVKLARFFNSPTFYFSANALVFYAFLSIAIYRSKINPFFCLLIFISFPLFFINSLSVVRTFSALAIVVFSISFLEKKKYVKYYVFVIIAVCFHNSALLAMIFPFFSNLKINRFALLSLWFLSFFAVGFIDLSNFDNLGVLAFYLQPTDVVEGTKAIYFFSIILLFLIAFKDNFINSDLFFPRSISLVYFNVFFFGVIVYSMFIDFGTLGHRLSLYGTFLSIFIIPKLLGLIRPLVFRNFLFCSCILFLFVIYILSVKVGSDALLPYKTVIF